MQIISITPTTEWYFISRNGHGMGGAIRPVAAWALTDTGRVNGLISWPTVVESGEAEALGMEPGNGLRWVPEDVLGEYFHAQELPDEVLPTLKAGGQLNEELIEKLLGAVK